MIKRFWLLTILIFITTSIGARSLVAFTQTLPPYYNCVQFGRVQISLNRKLHLNSEYQVPTNGRYSISPDNKFVAFITYDWSLKQHFLYLENRITYHTSRLQQLWSSSTTVYWSPNSHYLVAQERNNNADETRLTVFSHNHEVLGTHVVQTEEGSLVHWSPTSDYFFMQSSRDRIVHTTLAITLPEFEIMQISPFFEDDDGTESRLLAREWSPDESRVAYMVGTSLVMLDITHKSFSTTRYRSHYSFETQAHTRQWLSWSPDGRYIALSYRVRELGIRDVQYFKIFDTASADLQETATISFSINSVWYPESSQLLIWAADSSLYYFLPEQSNEHWSFRLQQFDPRTKHHRFIRSQVVTQDTTNGYLRFVRKQGQYWIMEHLYHGEFVTVFATNAYESMSFHWETYTPIVHISVGGGTRGYLVAENGSEVYPHNPTETDNTMSWGFYTFRHHIVIGDAILATLHNNENGHTTYELMQLDSAIHTYSLPEAISSQLDLVFPFDEPQIMILPSTQDNVMLVYGISGGFLLFPEQNEWRKLFEDRHVSYASWSPDGKRVLIQQSLANFAYHIYVYESDTGQEWDLGYFPNREFSSPILWDQCGDIISILRGN